MTLEEAIKMLESKLNCMHRSSSGIDEDCNSEKCDYCDLNYAQGTVGEQQEVLKEAISALEKQMPIIEPEQRWIPCSERMPEEHEWLGTRKFGTTISDEVYVTFENNKGERFCKHLQFQNGELSRYDQFHMDTWYKGSKPIAWMPLPEPWKGEGNEHND